MFLDPLNSGQKEICCAMGELRVRILVRIVTLYRPLLHSDGIDCLRPEPSRFEA